MPVLGEFNVEDFQEPDDVPRPIVVIGGLLTTGALELDFHAHRKAQLMLALSGVLTCEAQGGMWIVPAGRGLWVAGDVVHRIKAEGPAEGYTVFVEPDAVRGMSPTCCAVSVTPLLRQLVIRAAGFPLYFEMDGMEAHLATLLLEEMALARVEGLHLPMPGDVRLRRIFEEMVANPRDSATVDEWAGRVALSPRTLGRLLQRETGMSFGRWRQQLQVVLAIQKMAAGSSVQEVAFALGYESAGSFVTMFRKAVGQPPARFMAAQDGTPRRGRPASDADTA